MTTDQQRSAVTPGGVEDVHVLSPMQEGMLYHTLRHPDSAVYLQQAAVTFHGPLDPETFRRAWQTVLGRHTSLRTSFRWERLDKPVQVVHREARVPLEEHDWTDLSPQARRAREEDLLEQDRKNGFDLERAPLIRLHLARLADDRHRFAFSLHHIIQDGWSTGIMLREVGAAYRSLARGEAPSLPPVRPFRDYVRWLASRDPAEAEAFWRRRLDGFTEPTRLLRLSSPARTGNAQHARRHTLDAGATAALTAAATEQRVTLNTVLQAAWGLLLSRYSGRADVVFGGVSSGRPPELEGVEDMVGLFVTTVPTRLRVDPDREVGDWLREVQADALAARAHEHVPMTRIQEWSSTPPGVELFESVQVLQNLDDDPLAAIWRGFEGLTIDDFTYYTRTNYPLTLAGLPGERLGLRVSYDPTWLADDAAERLLGHLATLLTELTADPRRRLRQVPMLTGEERRHLAEWSTGPASEPGSAQRAVAAHAARAPQAVAVASGGRRLTYRELDQRVNRLAHHLAGRAVGRDTVVGILLPDRMAEVEALLAVSRAGGAPLVLDPQLPPARLAAEVRQVRPHLVLSVGDAAGGLPARDCQVLLLDEEAGNVERQPAEPPATGVAEDWLAAVVTTAGATGEPKPVLLDGAAVSAMSHAAGTGFGLTSDDVVLHLAPPGSADALFELHLALVSGATLRLPERAVSASALLADPAALAGVTCARVTPALLAALPGDGALPGVRTLLVSGERCAPGTLRRWAAGRALFHVYATAETAGLAAAARIGAEPDAPTALRPTSGVTAHVMDGTGEPLPVGVPGELHLGGPAVARGYLGRPALTAERFRSDPFSDRRHARLLRTGDLARWTGDGRLEVLGRTDRRMTVRGHVVDPAEVEDALVSLPTVEQVVVTADGRGEERRLVAHVVPVAEGTDRGAADLEDDQVGQWREVFGHTYAGPAASDDAEFNTVGWNSSFTGAAIPQEEMREWLDATLDRLRALAPRRVLEIGCGTGMLLLPLSRACEQYWATDLSPAAIDYVRGRLDPSVAERVTLRCQEGDDFTGVPEGAFDLVVINSVAQYFPHAEYLRRVLDRARGALRPGGQVFVGDVRSLPLMPAMHLDIQLANSFDHRDARELAQAVDRDCRRDEELVLHPDFFRRIVAESPHGGVTRITAKRGRAHNEMSRFRYDALLTFGTVPGDAGAAPDGQPSLVRSTWEEDGGTLEGLREALSKGPDALLVRSVPDLRAHGLAVAARALAEGSGPRNAGALRAAIDADDAVEPEALHALAADCGYAAELLVGEEPGTVDALFTPVGGPWDQPGAARVALWSAVDAARPVPLPWPRCANDPLTHRRERRLLPRLFTALEAALPSHLVPDDIVLAGGLPLTRHGRPDVAALPSPERPARADVEAFTPPRDSTELLIAKVWEDVLGVRPVGVTDNFFALGGHSLLAMRVISRLQRRFDRDLDLAVLFGKPTVAELADVLRPGDGQEARSPIVPLRSQGSKPPFFAVHQTGMNTLVYQFLADELGPDQPFYMLEHPDIARFERLEDLAAHYTAAIREEFPEGPYRLGGLSFGGLVAFEVAQQLVDAGEEVDLVTLFEASLAGTPPDKGSPQRLLAYRTHHYARVFELIFHRSVRLTEEELLPLDEQGQLELLYARVEEVLAGDIGIDLFRSTVEAVRTARRMVQGYRPRPWDRPLHLYIGLEPMPEGINDPEFYRPDRALGWDAVAPRLEITDVPGDHLTLLNPPHVQVLVRHLRPLLGGGDPEERS
ncbi:hypothetical protein AQ490_16150 [Wenjunlia vitaminophila]|uniref:Carrier domain-containing protein n=1 Tax=Wenjunlia vitaminophila TaxID=76728 RepID=A0A0T6LXX8_WENVI|nr:condensation domain-containing protein [Wenjunlia vitaminophila]KRV50591.1 hypothetical protein AQ490_16150 [Wenjunlia vitaminophila]